MTLEAFQAEELAHSRIHSRSPLLREFQTALDLVAVLEAEAGLALEATVVRHDWKGRLHRSLSLLRLTRGYHYCTTRRTAAPSLSLSVLRCIVSNGLAAIPGVHSLGIDRGSI